MPSLATELLSDCKVRFFEYVTTDLTGNKVGALNSDPWATVAMTKYCITGNAPVDQKEDELAASLLRGERPQISLHSWYDKEFYAHPSMEDRMRYTDCKNGIMLFSCSPYIVETVMLGWQKHEVEEDPRKLKLLLTTLKPLIQLFSNDFSNYNHKKAATQLGIIHNSALSPDNSVNLHTSQILDNYQSTEAKLLANLKF